MIGYFVTGTDTGVGKTTVTQSLARCARGMGKKVFAFKPVETGCETVDGALSCNDQEALWEASGRWQEGDLRGLYKLRSPVAPLVAAQEEGVRIDVDRILQTIQDGASQADVTLVEGAGGWRVPVTVEADIGAIACRTGFPAIVVARASLGTINHSLLTLEAIEREKCSIAALVLSRRPDENLAFTQSNAREIGRRWPGTILIYDGHDAVFGPLFQ